MATKRLTPRPYGDYVLWDGTNLSEVEDFVDYAIRQNDDGTLLLNPDSSGQVLVSANTWINRQVYDTEVAVTIPDSQMGNWQEIPVDDEPSAGGTA